MFYPELLDVQGLVRKLPAPMLAFAQANMGGADQLILADQLYFSKFRLAPDSISVDGSLDATYTFNQGHQVQPFFYGIGGSMQTVGFGATQLATPADTNLTNTAGRQTNNGEIFLVQSLGISFLPTSDPIMVQQVAPWLSITCGFAQAVSSQYVLGNAIFWPGGVGLSGGGFSKAILPNSGDAQTQIPGGFINNGWPVEGNTTTLLDPIIWYPQMTDSQFGMQINITQQVAYTATARAAASGVVAVVPPATAGAQGTFIDGFVLLRGLQLRPRSTSH